MARATWKKDKSRPLLPSLLPFFPQIDRAKPHGTETSFLLSPEKNRRREEGKKENLSLSISLSPSVRPLSIRLVKASCSEALSRFFFYIIATMNRQIKKLEDATIRSPPLPSSYTRRSKREARIFGDPSPERKRSEVREALVRRSSPRFRRPLSTRTRVGQARSRGIESPIF